MEHSDHFATALTAKRDRAAGFCLRLTGFAEYWVLWLRGGGGGGWIAIVVLWGCGLGDGGGSVFLDFCVVAVAVGTRGEEVPWFRWVVLDSLAVSILIRMSSILIWRET